MRDNSAVEMLRSLHHVQLAIPPGSEATCREFWSGILGCNELAKPPALADRAGCWFRAGSLEIHLGVERRFRPSVKAHPGIVVGDLHALARKLEEHGIAVEHDSALPGFKRFYCRDPFGNRLEFMEPTADAA